MLIERLAQSGSTDKIHETGLRAPPARDINNDKVRWNPADGAEDASMSQVDGEATHVVIH
jgi:hypothetical protein